MRAIFLGLFFASTSALACLNLSGTFKTCQSNNPENFQNFELRVEQKIVNKFPQFTFIMKDLSTGEERIEKYLADGKTKTTTETDPDSGTTIKTSTKTTCAGHALSIEVRAHLDAEEFANLAISTTKENNQLVQTITGTSMGEAANEVIRCQ